MKALYLATLLISFLGVLTLDLRFALAIRPRPLATILSVVVATAVLLVADLIAIGSHLFFRGPSPAMLGVDLAPELPVEEPIFLLFLCYLALVLYNGSGHLFRRLRGERP